METKRKALGKGLEQLFNSENINFENVEQEIIESATDKDIQNIPISEIRSNPFQPRRVFEEDKLEELAESIKEHGLFQPIIVKKSIKGYELVAGERRTKAARIAGYTSIPAIVREFSDEEMMEVALLENIQREDLNPIEEAEAYDNILKKTNITQEELAKKVSKSRSYITNILGLVNLPLEVKNLVSEKKLTMAHARILSKMDDEDYIISLAYKIVNNGMSVRELEALSRGEEIRKKHQINRIVPLNRIYSVYEQAMREKIGTRVTISSKKVTIPFDSDEDLARILEIINIDIGGDN
ncbi:MAG TPA: chromosome partitioning protein ParB [Firmicutes bacterium]|nr:chromosome partitioning protein ParB [Bacillota bacterium]